MTGIIWTTPEHYSLGLEYLFKNIVNDYLRVGISPFRREANFIEFKNNDIWKVVNIDKALGLRCNIAYIDQDLSSFLIANIVLPSCVDAPFKGVRYITLKE